MSDKNFKVKNGIDANGTITVSSFSDATSNLTINENVSTRRNLVLNPVFAVNDTTGWGSYFQSTNTIITDATAPYGTKVLQIEIPKDANPHGTIWLADESQQANIAYSVSAYVKGPAGVQGIFSGRPTLPDSSYLSEGSGALTFTFTGSWQRIYFTYTPSVAYKTGFQLTISPTQYSTTMNFYMHGIVVEYGSTTNLPYFDGSQNAYADKYRATTAWSGTANLSKSTVTYISQTANALEVKGNSSTIAKIDPYGTLTISASSTPTSINGQYGNLTVRSTTLADSLNAAAYINTGQAPGVGLILRGYGSQTADLQQWQYSDGNTYARISPYGQLAIGDVNPLIYSNARISLNTVATSAVGLVIRGVSSQTANLQEWQDSTGASRTVIQASGSFFSNHSATLTNAGAGGGNAIFTRTLYASAVPVVVRGAASQTANLQEWQDSAGTVLASISSTGKLTSAADALINGITLGWGGGQSYQNLAFGYNALSNTTTGVLNMAMGYRALQANTTGWNNMALGADALVANTTGQNNTAIGAQSLYSNTNGGENVAVGNWALLGGNGAYNTAVGASSMNLNSSSQFNTAVGRLSLYSISYGSHNTAIGQQAGGGLTSGASNAILGSEALILATTGSNNIAVGRDAGHSVVTGSANVFLGYQAGYSETGSNKLYISNSNTATPLIGGDFSASTLTLSANTTILSKTASTVGLIVKAISDQSTDIQQWKRSDDYLFASINQYGSFYTAGNLQVSVFAAFGSSTRGTEKVFILNDSAANAGLIVKGAASQTANLQEWQNSAGTASAYVTSGGSLKANSIRANTVSYLGVIGAVLTVATDIGIVVRGSASQTGNLQEWQDSAGAIKSFVRYDGFIRADASFQTPTIYSPTTGGTQVNLGTAWTYQINAAANTGIIVKGAASQTANLQEWQDSSGAVLSKIDKDGNITAADLTLSGNLTVNGTTTNLNSTNLVIEDKNIIIADVATPTDTTADGAGITIKGATDKTLTWVNSTKSFTTSDPLIIDGTNSTTVPLLVKVPTAQTTNSFEVQDSRGYSMFKVIAPAGGTAYNNGAIWIRPWGIGNVAAMGTDSSQGFYFVSPAASTINFGTGGGGKAFEIVVNNTFNRYKVEGKGTGVAPIFTTNGNDTDVNMHIYPKGAGKIGINTTTPTGYVHAVSSSSSTVGLIVEGASGQTSTNIFEVQRAGGSDPSFTVSHNYIDLNRNTTAAASMTVYGSNAGQVPLYVKGRASQSVNLQEWQNSTGQIRASIGSNGNLSLNYATGIRLYNTANTDYASLWMDNGSAGTNLYVKTNYPVLMGDVGVDTGASLTVATQSVSQIGQVIRGISSQTADLQQWQRSNGNPDLKVTNFGTLISGGGTTIASNPTINAYGAAMVISSGVNTYPMLILKAAASQSANIQEWQNSAGTAVAAIGPNGTVYMGSTNGANIANFYNGTNGYGAGAITSGGTFNINGANMGFPYTASGATLSVNAQSANQIGMTVRGYASQSYNLQEWQDSSGSAISWISSYGGARLYDLGIKGSPAGISWAYFGNDNTSTKNVVVRGFASQTANLQEWQNSAGTVLANVDSSGKIAAPIFQSTAVGAAYIVTGSNNNAIRIQTNGNTNVGLQVRGEASQTADLQQWQNSAGTVMALVDAYGRLGINTTSLANSTSGYSMVSIYNNNTVNTNLVIKSYPSQTATLTEWQNSSGTTLAKIDVLGNFTATSKSFDIAHPTKENMRLRYGSLEGPENGVYIRGTAESNIIELPDYWTGLVHENSITVSLTPVGSAQNIYVEKIENNKIYIGGNLEKAFFTIYGERKDIDKLTVEY